MLVWIWIGLAVLALGTVGGIAFAAVRGLAAYRTLRRVGGELTARMDHVARDADEIATKLERVAGGTGDLATALDRLRASRARLNVLLEAIAQMRAGVGRIRSVVPRKT